MKKIYINGDIYTITNGRAEAFVVENGKFSYVGSNEVAKTYKDLYSTVIDLNNQFITAGFNDSHMHLLSTGLSIDMINLNSAKSINELIEISKDYLKDKKYDNNRWIMGRSWNQDHFENPIFPNKYDLDKISTEYPICFMRACYHVYVVNSKALELMGVTKDTAQIKGGQFDIDKNGEPTGVFREAAVEMITSKISPLNFDDIKKTIQIAIKNCNSAGITSVHSDDLNTLTGLPYSDVIKAYKELESENKLNVRVYEQSRFSDLDTFKNFIGDGYYTGVGSDKFKIGPLKIIGDGSLGARTALLNKPYSDDLTNSGIGILNQEQLNEWVEYGQENNMQIAIHGIGDKMMYMILTSYEKAQKKFFKADHRNGIVHAQITDKYILNKMKELDLLAYIQTIFIDSDSSVIENRVGKERMKDTYNFKTMLDLKLHVSNSSDAPIETTNIFKGIQLAVTRASFDNMNRVFLKEQAMTVKEAIYSYTKAGAYASFEEDLKGSIEVGKVADFVILDNDPFAVDAFKLKDILVLETYLDGKMVWKK